MPSSADDTEVGLYTMCKDNQTGPLSPTGETLDIMLRAPTPKGTGEGEGEGGVLSTFMHDCHTS